MCEGLEWSEHTCLRSAHAGIKTEVDDEVHMVCQY